MIVAFLLLPALQRDIARLSEDNLKDASEPISLTGSYSHGDMDPMFKTQVIGTFRGNLNGNYNNVTNINLRPLSTLQSIFGHCNGAQISNIGFVNVKAADNTDANSVNSIICSHAKSTVFRNIYVELSGTVNTKSNFSLICHSCDGITVDNVTITGQSVGINVTNTFGLFATAKQSTISKVKVDLQLDVLGATTVALFARESSNTTYEQISIAGTHQVFKGLDYSLLFLTTNGDTVKNVVLSHDVVFYAAKQSNYLLGQTVTSLTMSQVQFISTANEEFDVSTTIVTDQITATAYYYLAVTGAERLKVDVISQTAIDAFYNTFNQTELMSLYFLNTNGLYMLTTGEPFTTIEHKFLCSTSADCQNGGACEYVEKGVPLLGLLVRTFYCKCQDGFYGQHCEKQIAKVNGRCEAGYTGAYCTACELSHANINGRCLPNCIIHGGHADSGGGCVQCQQNYTSTYCTECAPGYIMIEATCYRNDGGCQRTTTNGVCTGCNVQNYTGDFCNECKENYVRDPLTQKCFYNMNKVCEKTGGFNLTSQSCRSCPTGSQNQLCLSVADNTTKCLMHGGLANGNCTKCQTGYSGSLCESCTSGYLRKGDMCVPQSECEDGLFDAQCRVRSDCTGHGGVDYNMQRCKECQSQFDYPFCTTCKHRYDLVSPGQCGCHANYTGSNCMDCQSTYYKYQERGDTQYSCYFDNRSACSPQPYDPVAEKCRYCAVGQTGRYCEDCRPFASGANCSQLDYAQLCQQHGGLSGGKCAQCQRNYTGDLCDSCAGAFTPDASNNRCVEDGAALCDVFFGLDSGACVQCVNNRTGATCQDCLPRNIMGAGGRCAIDQYDPENGLEAAAQLACSVHGGVAEDGGCAFCQHGFGGRFCRTCAAGYAAANSTRCTVNRTHACAQYGGWNVATDRCADCGLLNGFTSGALCDQCAGDEYYYSPQDARCATVASYVNGAKERGERGLRIACIVFAVVFAVLLIAFIAVIVVYCSTAKQQRQERSEQQSTVRGDEQIMATTKVKDSPGASGQSSGSPGRK